MGAWGIGISSNDTYADIYDEFFELYNDGLSVEEITTKLIVENQETIETWEDAPNFWYALAKAQWECLELTENARSRVELYIQSGEDLEIWKELGATQADIRTREKALVKFLSRLSSERTSPRKRKKKKLYDSVFKKGDCLVYRMDNGNYGGAFVLSDERSTLVGANYIAITTINKPEKPTLDDFGNSEVYVRRSEEISLRGAEMIKRWVDQPQIGGIDAWSFAHADFEIEVVGTLSVYNEYTPSRIVSFGYIVLRSLLPVNEKYELINGKPKSKLKLTKWTKKPSIFRFWI